MNIMNYTAFSFVIIFILMLFAAYFAACETAITAYSKPKIFKFASDGNKKAQTILSLQNETGLVISALLTCNTILNSFTISFSTLLGINLFGEKFIVIYSIIQTMFVVFFTEILPKMLTISNPEKILIPSAYFIKFIFVALKPINNILGAIAQKFINLTKFNNKAQDEFCASLDELKGAIDLHKRTNPENTEQEKEMLKRILDLGSVTVSNIMIHRKNVTTICINDPIDFIIEQIVNCPFTRIPLWQDTEDNIIGILHAKDLLKIVKKNEPINASTLISIAINPRFIPESKNLLNQLQSFKIKHEHFALVIDEYGSFMGIVTLEDIIEEIVGEISDEHDLQPSNGIRLQKDGAYIINGSVNIRDLNREIGTNFHNSGAATVAGLIINSIGIIPEIGQMFVLFGYKFEILKKQRNQITLIKIQNINNFNEIQI